MTIEWELDHVGMVVKNIDAAVAHYQRIGMELSDSPDLKSLSTPKGNIEYKACFVQNKVFRIRLIQPGKANDMFKKYLNKYGEGINYMALRAANLAEEKARLVGMGIPVIANSTRPDGSNMEIFFDTSKSGNVNIALFSDPSIFPAFKPDEEHWKFWHLGFIVKDAKKFAEQYQAIGLKIQAGPIERNVPQKVLDTWTIHGKIPPPTSGPFKSWDCRLQNKQGSFLLTVTQPVQGKSLHREFLGNHHGEGVEHMHFMVDDLFKEMATMISNGFPCIMTQMVNGKLRETFYDTREIGNVATALWDGMKPPFEAKPE